MSQEWGRERCLNVLVRILKGKRPHGRTNVRWNDNVKIGGKKCDGRTRT
jgi:hypothetical protein